MNNSVPHATGCLETMGVTAGGASAAFSVAEPVRRQAMAWALVNSARAAGVEIPAAADQGFEDIENLPSLTRDVINQLAALGITRGKTASSFDPAGTVTRKQMAVFFTRLLALSPVGPGANKVTDIEPDDNVFTDIGAVTGEARHAIGVIYELGVTVGTTASTYSPSDPVTGGQMALFLTRLLAHTPARGPNQIAYSDDRGLWMVNTDGTNPTLLADADDSRFAGWSPDGTRFAYYRGNQRAVYLANADGTNPTKIKVNNYSWRWSPDGTHIAYHGRVLNDQGIWVGDGLWVANADGTNPTKLTDTDSRSFEGWSPDGTRIAYRGRVLNDQGIWVGDGLWVANADGANPTKIAYTGRLGNPFGGWSPDGTRIAYTSPVAGGLVYLANADGTNPTQLTDSGRFQGWSPDGTRFAYEAYGIWHGLWVVNADGTNPTKIIDADTDWWFGGWSPDGTRIAYADQVIDDQGYRVVDGLWVVNADGTNPTKIADADTDWWFWGWSPDGTRIAYTSPALKDQGYRVVDGLWVVNADGTNPTKIIDTKGWRFWGWSPDGTRIAYTDQVIDDQGRWVVHHRLWVANADGTNPTILDDHSRFGGWSPDGTRIAYTSSAFKVQGLRAYELWVGKVWVANADGTNTTKITDRGAFGDWRPG